MKNYLTINYNEFLNETWQDDLRDTLKNSTPYVDALFIKAKRMDKKFAAKFLALVKREKPEIVNDEKWKSNLDFNKWYNE